ncbi:MAG: large-conductance mechanosensitive channel protein MscL [Syntrophothermus sp.]
MLKEFREFALKGNVMDMAVGIIIGAAFGVIVASLVNDIIMPPIGLVLGNLDFSNLFIVLKEGAKPGPYTTPEIAKEAGAVTLNYGRFINNIITFLIVAFSIFIIIKAMNNMRRQKEGIPEEVPTIKDCPFCYSHIPIKATKCPACTADLH